ncbi:septation protein SepH [Demequina sp. B12]|uniref:septation protein SepH n=1 Tax=Demequina sp. B12 TaxID=2992757 RepID=UPI00237B1BAE|nr:septation protein SepH [Demequina sp. B12]MDE0572987.1 septation protein SepH [Demequina sp. B12]
MTRLSLVRPADDGEHLIVADESGNEYELALTDDLRRAASTVRHRPAPTDDDAAPMMTPREIQQRIRGGLNAAELSELTGQPVEFLARYEAPVLAERSYIAAQAKTTRIGRDADSPILGDLVTDRLAGRGVDIDSVVWDAWREPDEPWMVAVDYRVDGRNVRAQWSFDHSARTVNGLDDESRWLSETELLDVPIPKRHLSAVRDASHAAPLEPARPIMPVTEPTPIVAEPTQTELLLDDLETRRGTRDTVEVDEEDDADDDGGFEGFGPAVQRQRQADVGFTASPPKSRHPAGSALSASAPSAASAPAPAAPAPKNADTERESEPKKPRRGRSSVPSWDEIVFGAKNE